MRESSKTFEDLVVWQKAHSFVLATYRLSATFPGHELYGLTSQLRRAAVSVAANVAEGYGRTSRAEKVRFFSIAQGSADECRYYLVLAKDLKYGDVSEHIALLQEVGKLLGAYSRSISDPHS